MNADVNIPNSSENATLQDDSQKVNSSAKRGIADENPAADVRVSLNHSSGQIGNAEHVNEEPKNPHKILKKHLETEVGRARMFCAMRRMIMTCSVAQNAMGNIIADAQTYHLIKLHYF